MDDPAARAGLGNPQFAPIETGERIADGLPVGSLIGRTELVAAFPGGGDGGGELRVVHRQAFRILCGRDHAEQGRACQSGGNPLFT